MAKNFLCYRCKTKRPGKPARHGPNWKLCQDCFDESQTIKQLARELDNEMFARADLDA